LSSAQLRAGMLPKFPPIPTTPQPNQFAGQDVIYDQNNKIIANGTAINYGLVRGWQLYRAGNYEIYTVLRNGTKYIFKQHITENPSPCLACLSIPEQVCYAAPSTSANVNGKLLANRHKFYVFYVTTNGFALINKTTPQYVPIQSIKFLS
jgi:hypothetical protein